MNFILTKTQINNLRYLSPAKAGSGKLLIVIRGVAREMRLPPVTFCNRSAVGRSVRGAFCLTTRWQAVGASNTGFGKIRHALGKELPHAHERMMLSSIVIRHRETSPRKKLAKGFHFAICVWIVR